MDEHEVYDSVPAHTLENGDQIVWNGDYIVLDLAEDVGESVVIEWTDDLGDWQDAMLDPYAEYDLWRYV
jgi:hypothetical protein